MHITQTPPQAGTLLAEGSALLSGPIALCFIVIVMRQTASPLFTVRRKGIF
jgi:hypothetical protein